jgi:hypothetical protein
MSWEVKKEVLFERTLPEARWNYSKIGTMVPIEPKREWKVKSAV